MVQGAVSVRQRRRRGPPAHPALRMNYANAYGSTSRRPSGCTTGPVRRAISGIAPGGQPGWSSQSGVVQSSSHVVLPSCGCGRVLARNGAMRSSGSGKTIVDFSLPSSTTKPSAAYGADASKMLIIEREEPLEDFLMSQGGVGHSAGTDPPPEPDRWGVRPLQFAAGASRESLGLTDLPNGSASAISAVRDSCRSAAAAAG